jgi:serine/threonine protein kinase
MRILQALKHNHLVQYIDSFVTRAPDARLCIVLEWAEGGDLAAQIASNRKAGRRYSEPEIIRILFQICSALSYCHHELKLLHRDLKPANIFLDKNGNGVHKI